MFERCNHRCEPSSRPNVGILAKGKPEDLRYRIVHAVQLAPTADIVTAALGVAIHP